MVGFTLPPNILLGWKGMAVSITLAYYDKATIMAVNSFIVQAPGLKLDQYHKTFMC